MKKSTIKKSAKKVASVKKTSGKAVRPKFGIGDAVKYGEQFLFVGRVGQNSCGGFHYALFADHDCNNLAAEFVGEGKLKRVKTYAVDVHWTVARSFVVPAEDKATAMKSIWSKIGIGNEIDAFRGGFEATEDIEVNVSGEEDPSTHEIAYY